MVAVALVVSNGIEVVMMIVVMMATRRLHQSIKQLIAAPLLLLSSVPLERAT